jgi:hypothetical protein
MMIADQVGFPVHVPLRSFPALGQKLTDKPEWPATYPLHKWNGIESGRNDKP